MADTAFRRKLLSISFGSVNASDGERVIGLDQVREVRQPSWEAGLAGERRPGGGFMPILKDHSLTPMGVKEYGERRTELTETRRRINRDGATAPPPAQD
jgi:hypothetical protein